MTQNKQLYGEAYAHYQAGNPTKAAESFRTLCSEHPLESKFWFGLGASLQESMRYEEALQSWAMAALLDPMNPYPHFHAAECSISLSQLKDAGLALNMAAERIWNEAAHPLKEPIGVLKEAWKL